MDRWKGRFGVGIRGSVPGGVAVQPHTPRFLMLSMIPAGGTVWVTAERRRAGHRTLPSHPPADDDGRDGCPVMERHLDTPSTFLSDSDSLRCKQQNRLRFRRSLLFGSSRLHLRLGLIARFLHFRFAPHPLRPAFDFLFSSLQLSGQPSLFQHHLLHLFASF